MGEDREERWEQGRETDQSLTNVKQNLCARNKLLLFLCFYLCNYF